MDPMSSGRCTFSMALRGSYCRIFCRIYCRILCRILFPHIARSHTFSKDVHESHGDPCANFKKIFEHQRRTIEDTFIGCGCTRASADLSMWSNLTSSSRIIRLRSVLCTSSSFVLFLHVCSFSITSSPM